MSRLRLFSERYNSNRNDKEYSTTIKKSIIEFLFSFDESLITYPDRFNSNYSVLTSISKIVIPRYYENYECILKNLTEKDTGQADQLSKALDDTHYLDDLPISMNFSGFQQNVLMTLPYIRNKVAAGHGKGNQEIILTKSLAKLSLNLASSLISFLIDQYKTHNIKNKVEQIIDYTQEDMPF